MDVAATLVTKQKFNDVHQLFDRGGKIRKGDGFISLKPVNWNPEGKDRNWIRQLHMWRFLDPAFFSGLGALKESQLQVLKSVVEDWEQWVNSNAEFSAAHVWIDHVVGVRASKVALLLESLSFFEDSFSKVLRRVSLQHLKMLDKKRFIKINNHGVFDVHGLMLLLESMPKEWIDDLEREGIRSRLNSLATLVWKSQFTTQGLHKENSPHYHYVAKYLLEKYVKSGLYSDNKYIEILHGKLLAGEQYQHYFDGRQLPFGDSDMVLKSPEDKISGGDGNALETDRDRIVSAGSLDGRVLVKYYFSGVPSTIAINCSYHEKTHKHFDCQTLVWSEVVDILIDGGKYCYEKSPEREYFISPRAHNVLYQESDYGFNKPDVLYGDGVKSIWWDEKFFCCLMEVPGFVKNSIVTRAVLFSIDSGLVVVDKLVSDTTANLVSNWLLGPLLNVEKKQEKSNLVSLRYNDACSFFYHEVWLSDMKSYVEKNGIVTSAEGVGNMIGRFSPEFLKIKEAGCIFTRYTPRNHLTKASMFLRGERKASVYHNKITGVTSVKMKGGEFEVDFGEESIRSF